MSYQSLDPEVVIDPFTVTSFTGQDSITGLYYDADATNSSVLFRTNDTHAFYIDKFQNVGINTLSPTSQLDVNSSNGACLQLTYNGSSTSKTNFSISSDGKLLMTSGGNEVGIDSLSNLNIKSHDGSTIGLMLNNTLVRSTADQLNYNIVTPGTATANKSLVIDGSRNITNIAGLTATTLTGTISTAAQPNIESVTILDITGHNGIAGLSLSGELVSVTAEQLNYNSVNPGTALANKAVVLNATRDIININSLTASTINGTLGTSSQPNITSLGTITALDVDGTITGITELSVNTTESGRALNVNSDTGGCIALYYDAATSVTNKVDMLVSSTGSLSLTPSGGSVDITTHDGSTVGLKLGGVLVSASADQINYLAGTITGSAIAGKALIVDSSRNINNIATVSATTFTGTLSTAAQPNIASVNALDITTHDAATVGFKLGGVLVTASSNELNNLSGVVAGTASASKALVLDATSNITGINSLSATSLAGTITSASQPNIAYVNTLDITTHDGATQGLSLDGVLVTATAAQINSIFGDGGGGGTFGSLTVTGDIDLSGHNGTDTGLVLGNTLVTATADELNFLDIVTAGLAEATKALVLDSSSDIAGINSLSATSITGELQTADQPNIESVTILDITGHDGTTTGLSLGGELVTATAAQINSIFGGGGGGGGGGTFGDLTITNIAYLTGHNGVDAGLSLGGTLVTASASDLNTLYNVTAGTAGASKALVLDASSDIAGINSLSATSLTGELQTAAQPNITSLGTVEDLTFANDAIITMGGATISATEFARLDAGAVGVASPNKVLVVDGSKNISGIGEISISKLTLAASEYTYLTNGIQSFSGQLSDIPNCTLSASSPSLGLTIFTGFNGYRQDTYSTMIDASQYEPNSISFGASFSVYAMAIIWEEANSEFIFFAADRDAINSYGNIYYTTSSNGYSWSTMTFTGIAAKRGTTIKYCQASNQYVMFTESRFYYSTTGRSDWTFINLSATLKTNEVNSKDSIQIVGNRVLHKINTTTSGVANVVEWNGTTWTASTINSNVIKYARAYAESEDRLYFTHDSVPSASSSLVMYYIDNISSLAIADWGSNVLTVTFDNLGSGFYKPKMEWYENYGVVLTAFPYPSSTETWSNSLHALIIDNLTVSVNFLGGADFDGLTYGYSSGNEVLSAITSDGSLTIPATGNLNQSAVSAAYSSAIGSSAGIIFGNTTITESELSIVDGITAGNASASKALVLNSSSDISGINSLSATSITGELQTAAQPNITSVNILDITGHDGTTAGLSLGGELLTATAAQINSIFGAGGEGTFTNITVNDSLTLANADGSTMGLVLGETLVTATGAELNTLDGVVAGTASASKALVLDASSDITGINSLTTTSITGELQTAAQPNITSVNILDITGHDGGLAGLTLNSILVTSTATELNYVDVIAGTASASKALVLDASSDITGINSLTATSITGELQTAAQPNITSVGTLTSIDTSGDLTLGSTVISETDIAKIDGITDGTAFANKAIVLDSSKDIAGINSLSAVDLTGELQTAAQPNITSVTTLNIDGHDGSTQGLSLNGSLILSTSIEINTLSGVSMGIASASKALVLDASSDITGINSLTATSITGELQTAAQPNITSVGTLTSIDTSGDLTLGSTVISETDIAKIGGITDGTASASKALVLDASSDITGINSLSSTVLAVGTPSNTDLPVEVGFVAYTFAGAYAYNNSSNAHGIVDAGSGTSANYSLRTDGRILCTGEIEITSDRRMKKNVLSIDSDIAKSFVMNTTPVKFNWKSDTDEVIEYGYIAQDVYKSGFTNMVSIVDYPGMEEEIDEDGFISPKDAKYSFAPGKIIPLLALNQRDIMNEMEIKDDKIKTLEERIETLEKIVMNLK